MHLHWHQSASQQCHSVVSKVHPDTEKLWQKHSSPMCVKIISLAIGVHVNPSCRQSYLKSVPSEFFFTLQYLRMQYSYWTKIALKDLLWLALCYHIMHYVLISFELIFVKLLSAMGEQHVWGFLLRDLTWTSTQIHLWVYNVVKMGFPFAGIIPVGNCFAV